MYRLLLVSVTLALHLLSAAPATYAQMGIYDEVGVGFGVEYTPAEYATLKGANIGIMAGPFFEFGTGLSLTKTHDFDLTTIGATPYLAVYPIRQGEDSPLSMMFHGSYGLQWFHGDAADALDLDDGNTYDYGVAFFRSLEVSKSFRLIPFMGVGHLQYTAEERGWGYTSSDDVPIAYLVLRNAFVVEVANGAYLAVTPSITFSEGDSTFGLSAAVVVGSTERP